MVKAKILRPDAKGRITLGEYAKGISSYKVILEKNHKIILEPYVKIPAREKWLLNNENTLKKVKKGIEDSAKGRLKSSGKFSKYKDEELE